MSVVCQRGPELGLPPPWDGNIDEARHDTQEEAGTSEGQADTTGACRFGVPGPFQGFSMCVHRGDREKVWGEKKGT